MRQDFKGGILIAVLSSQKHAVTFRGNTVRDKNISKNFEGRMLIHKKQKDGGDIYIKNDGVRGRDTEKTAIISTHVHTYITVN